MLATMRKTATSEEPDDITENENRTEFYKMLGALTSIACEIQKFQETSIKFDACPAGPPRIDENEKIIVDLLKYKTKINPKKNRVQKFRRNHKTACFVAKTVGCASEDESGSFKHYLTCARSECADLLEKYKSNKKTLDKLSRENEMLRRELDNVSNFIQLGYGELQKMRHEYSTETSALAQLKKLIGSCGEYYADYHNEHERCLQLKQRNSFLINKICILEYSVEALSEQLKTLKYDNLKLQKENYEKTRNRFSKSKPSNENNAAIAEVNKRLDGSLVDAVEITEYNGESGDPHDKLDPETDFDLTPHLSIVKKLLNDQDMVIQDLKALSVEFLNLA